MRTETAFSCPVDRMRFADMTTPLEAYEAKVADGEIDSDPAQLNALNAVGRLFRELGAPPPEEPAKGFLSRFGFGKTAPAAPPPKGIYLHGPVGRGKSMLMDLFFDLAPVTAKRRVHFHAFMLETHDRIYAWRQAEKAGKVKGGDPIPHVAEEIAREAQLLCFDEFQVEDIADASILGRLFTQLFDARVVMMATSNVAPDDLYRGGLNRHRFLPFIDLLKERVEVVSLASQRDYRLDRMKGLPVFHTPLGAEASQALDHAFDQLTDHDAGHPVDLEVKGRKVHVPLAARGVARFTFEDLCAKPLGAVDYLRIAESFHTVIIDGIPKLSPARRNEAKRFVTLIDTLYEAHVRLIASAEAEPQSLYPEGDGAFAFERTVSRMMEMQSADYLERDAEAAE